MEVKVGKKLINRVTKSSDKRKHTFGHDRGVDGGLEGGGH